MIYYEAAWRRLWRNSKTIRDLDMTGRVMEEGGSWEGGGGKEKLESHYSCICVRKV